VTAASTSRSRVVVLGSTGSIGTSCLDVAAALPERIEIVGLCANSSLDKLLDQVRRFRPRWVAVRNPDLAVRFQAAQVPPGTRVLVGDDGIAELVSERDVDIVVSAVVGAAGLTGTVRALEAGKTVALANKETLVLGGPHVMKLAAARGATILPVDSEHSAIFQALQCGKQAEVQRLVLTGSGGPFRGKRRVALEDVTPEQALKHPTWNMGAKITVDSATLMNKALEVIEARWLFGIAPERIRVLIHPQSVIHSFVEFCDGSVLAQLSPPDMRLPIQYALTWPERVPGGPAKRLDWDELTAWTFEQPDSDTFPALQLGYEAARRGGTCGAVLNAANEAAVDRFLHGTLKFLDIPRACADVLERHSFVAEPALEELLAADRWARQEVARIG
jgi:1-deoxy-D-xylulose-5-phosphate reductoisomerase